MSIELGSAKKVLPKKMDDKLFQESKEFTTITHPLEAKEIGHREGLKEVTITDTELVRKYQVYPELMLEEEKPRIIVLEEIKGLRVTLRRPVGHSSNPLTISKEVVSFPSTKELAKVGAY